MVVWLFVSEYKEIRVYARGMDGYMYVHNDLRYRR